MTKSILYLHGLASSPASKKANFYRQQLESDAVHFAIPDLNVPDFEHLTLSAILARTAETVRACPPGDVYIIGSSLGGLAAIHFADRYRDQEAARVRGLVLLAPAFDFTANRLGSMGETWLDDWREVGAAPIHHYAHDKTYNVHYGFVEDVLQYDSYAVNVSIPLLIYHGLNDTTVDYRQSVRFAQKYPNADLRLLESDHELLDKTGEMLAGMRPFFGL